MNIVTPIPTNVVFSTANVNTEAARRDNLSRETIPATSTAEQGDNNKGLGSDSDRARSPGQPSGPFVYEKPQIQPQVSEAFGQQEDAANSGKQQDAANGESAGKESAEDKQKQQAEEQQLKELKDRDAEVRRHEEAHASVGGQYAGSPQYEYKQGPDGKRYAVGGEVSIDISEAASPEKTIQKMEQVRAAALAPEQPSQQDLKVAAEAEQKSAEAKAELAKEKTQTSSTAGLKASLSDLDNTPSKNIAKEGDLAIRTGVIQQFYQTISAPRNEGFSASA
ncbi:putative metalloprotease CJM1_0395 family protein [Alteromonas sp. ASW11-130]|uniref:putative metalloprotease CJM1_0395 family protein n=1 Tax=Alteromonas sp. ASW11-130 TaxID=3015775 RepID=UPI002241F093|nr:putative metalloprotease CJM1_0395 family protein [Alteromonas sp. ASW11-130]MCW8093316.1 putative metalloprotease CJM1_0395 family protein [Alteromonas sp. ASW11-130]